MVTTTPHARRLPLLVLLTTLAACDRPEPPADFGATFEPAVAERQLVAAANPLAAAAGQRMLRRGGTALDAAVAVQAVLAFVEAPESGIGGGGFLLYLDAARGTVTVYDGREQAPAAATADRFQLLGRPMPRWAAVPSGRAVGVPGLVAMLHDAHAAHGVLPWTMLFGPAIDLAERGVPIPARLERQIAQDFSLRLFRSTRHQFVHPWRHDRPLTNPALAATLRAIASGGAPAFYRGPIADAVVEAARGRRPWPGDLTRADLAGYRAIARDPVCGRYREWTLCGPPPPSAGGIGVLQILAMLERFDLAALEPGSPQAIHLIAEASRLAFADRYRYLGDPAFVEMPLDALLDRGYLAQRAALIDRDRAMASAAPGIPGISPRQHDAPPIEVHEGIGTTHFTIVDAAGNVASLTSSIEAPFGSRIMAAGFLLNNQLTDFAFRAEIDGRVQPNAVAPGKRPLSSMTPVIVWDASGEVRLALGSRGGSRIVGHVVKTLVGVLDWELDLQSAIAAPNFLHRGDRLELEYGTVAAAHAEALRRLGHDVATVTLTSGTHGIERSTDGWHGGADPRLGGAALGD